MRILVCKQQRQNVFLEIETTKDNAYIDVQERPFCIRPSENNHTTTHLHEVIHKTNTNKKTSRNTNEKSDK